MDVKEIVIELQSADIDDCYSGPVLDINKEHARQNADHSHVEMT